MVPAQSNYDVAKHTTDELLFPVPEAFGLRAFAEGITRSILEDRVRIAMMYAVHFQRPKSINSTQQATRGAEIRQLSRARRARPGCVHSTPPPPPAVEALRRRGDRLASDGDAVRPTPPSDKVCCTHTFE
jgi:hypothetical protein